MKTVTVRVCLAAACISTVPSFAATRVGNCPISADFGTEPEIINSTVPVANYEVANTVVRAFLHGGLVSIECTSIDPDVVFPGMTDLHVLESYARFFSIDPIEESYAVSRGTDPAPHVGLIGEKEVSGVTVTYSYMLFRFDDSFALVMTGVPKGTTDISDVESFLGSLEISEVR